MVKYILKGSIFSLHKALDILCCFDFNQEALSAQEISERLNIPLSTTYRYLAILLERGFLARTPDTKKYELGLMLFQLGNIVSSKIKFVDIVMPHMISLSYLTGETVFLSVLNRSKAVCIEKIETNKLIKMSIERGASFPLYAASSGKLLLAHQDGYFIDSIIQKVLFTKFTDYTITDPILLKKELKDIREQGFAISDQEAELGAKSISAPIIDHKGKVIAALSIAGPSERIKSENIPPLIQMVKDAAKKASYDLTYGGSDKYATSHFTVEMDRID
jgi:IclR family KDG regulon transcriptional repressor